VGVTVLIVTHDLRQVERLGKRTLFLDQGQLLSHPTELESPAQGISDSEGEESISEIDDNLDLFRDTGFEFDDEEPIR